MCARFLAKRHHELTMNDLVPAAVLMSEQDSINVQWNRLFPRSFNVGAWCVNSRGWFLPALMTLLQAPKKAKHLEKLAPRKPFPTIDCLTRINRGASF